MKNLMFVLGLLVFAFVGIFYYLHHHGSPTDAQRKQEAHAMWKQSAIEPETSTRPEAFADLKIPPTPEAQGEVELRMPASNDK